MCRQGSRALCCQGPGPCAVGGPGPVSEQEVLPQTLQCQSWVFHSFGTAQDGDFSEKRFRDIVNAALANDIGNLLNRTLNLLKKNCGSAMPADSSQVPDNSPVRNTAQQQVTYLGNACRHHICHKCSSSMLICFSYPVLLPLGVLLGSQYLCLCIQLPDRLHSQLATEWPIVLYTVNCCHQLVIPCNRHAYLTLSVLLLKTSCSLFVQSTMQPRLFPALLHFLPLSNCSGISRCYVSTLLINFKDRESEMELMELMD